MRSAKSTLWASLVFTLTACSGPTSEPPPPEPVPPVTPELEPVVPEPVVPEPPQRALITLVPCVTAVYPHDPTAYTEGLVFRREGADEILYESTGLPDRSTVRRVQLTTGEVLASQPVPRDFAEGLALDGDTLIQLTEEANSARRFTAPSLTEVTPAFVFDGYGWGLATHGEGFLRSDGTNHLHRHRRSDFRAAGDIIVTFQGAPVARGNALVRRYPALMTRYYDGTQQFAINELECVGDDVYGNIWLSPDLIVRLSAVTGEVDAIIEAARIRRWLDPASSARIANDTDAVLNGIAYDDATETFLLTGKRWPSVFRVRFAPSEAACEAEPAFGM